MTFEVKGFIVRTSLVLLRGWRPFSVHVLIIAMKLTNFVLQVFNYQHNVTSLILIKFMARSFWSWATERLETLCFTNLGKLNFLWGSILSSSQFLLLPQLPQKMELTSKVDKIDS
jgi:hypothetical protein